MTPYAEQKFSIPELQGISKKTIDEHLKLYAGYVKHTNLILQSIEEIEKKNSPSTPLGTNDAYIIGELRRRLGWEFDGMRNHEYYFSALAGGAKPLPADSDLMKALSAEFGSFDNWMTKFKSAASARGIGWAVLYFDKETKRFVHAWVEQHQGGQLAGLSPLIMLDMFEHAYLMDYVPSDKKKYIDAYLAALNWSTIEKIYQAALS